MGVVTKGCRWIAVPETDLGFEYLAGADALGGDAVSEAMQRRPLHSGGSAEPAELVREGVGGDIGGSGWCRCEQPVDLRLGSPLFP